VGESRFRLVAGRDYPRTYGEFRDVFSDDEACAAFLEELRWPSGFACPSCGVVAEPWRLSRGRLVCSTCRHQTTPTAGTILGKTRTPLTTWFEAAWHVTTAKNGMSAKTLERTLGTSYRVAWMMLQRFRVAMVRAERGRLSGEVEIDETFVGGVGNTGRGTEKCTVAIAVEVKQGKGFGRVRMAHLPDASGSSLIPFVRQSVSQGARVHTDGWSGYNGLKGAGYQHVRVSLRSSNAAAHTVMPGVHRVASLLKRWILGTHQGSVSRDHLQAYLEEFTFRFNRRTSRNRGLVFRRLLEQAVVTPTVTESNVTHGFYR